MNSVRTQALRARCEQQRQLLGAEVANIHAQVAAPDAWLGMAGQALKEPAKWVSALGGWSMLRRAVFWWGLRKLLGWRKR